jgi:hypothetical protein
MSSVISNKEVKEQAQVKAVVLKLTRLYKSVTFHAVKKVGNEWYEIICDDWEMYVDDEMFQFNRDNAVKGLPFKIIFAFSSKPEVNKGVWEFTRKS